MAINPNVVITSVIVEFISYDGEVSTDQFNYMISDILQKAKQSGISYNLISAQSHSSNLDIDDGIGYVLCIECYYIHGDYKDMLDIMYKELEYYQLHPFDYEVVEYEQEYPI